MSDKQNAAANAPKPAGTPATPAPAANVATEPAATKAVDATPSKSTETAFDTATGIITVETTAKNGKSAVIRYELGKTIEAAVAKLGAEVALSKLAAEIARNLGNNARGRLQKGVDPNEVARIMAEWKPGITTPRGPKKSVGDLLLAEFSGLSPEQQLAKMQELMANAAKAAAAKQA
jgi:hypothetical protein